MKLNKKRMKTEPHVPFIAMADIAWQVVILFLVASAFIVSNAVNMDLPSMAQDQDQNREEPIQVVAGADTLMVDKTRIEYADLLYTLQERLKTRKTAADKGVVINCRPDLPWQRSLDIMSDIAKAGGVPVFATEEGK